MSATTAPPARAQEVKPVTMVRTESLSKVYGEGPTAVTALDRVNLQIAPGEFVAVMGPSGCGKSTLLHLIGGLDRPSSGRVIVDGYDLAKLDDDRLTKMRRRRIGFVFQFSNLIPVLSALENAALPLILDGVRPAQSRARAGEWLQQVGLEDRIDRRPDQLSGGEQQRVAIARALTPEPALVLADEPTGNLDTEAGAEIAALLGQVSGQWGQTVLMVTHDPDVAAYADRIVFLRDGRIVEAARS
jgi:putative ABC transport system ATP-binding protein